MDKYESKFFHVWNKINSNDQVVRIADGGKSETDFRAQRTGKEFEIISAPMRGNRATLGRMKEEVPRNQAHCSWNITIGKGADILSLRKNLDIELANIENAGLGFFGSENNNCTTELKKMGVVAAISTNSNKGHRINMCVETINDEYRAETDLVAVINRAIEKKQLKMANRVKPQNLVVVLDGNEGLVWIDNYIFGTAKSDFKLTSNMEGLYLVSFLYKEDRLFEFRQEDRSWHILNSYIEFEGQRMTNIWLNASATCTATDYHHDNGWK